MDTTIEGVILDSRQKGFAPLFTEFTYKNKVYAVKTFYPFFWCKCTDWPEMILRDYNSGKCIVINAKNGAWNSQYLYVLENYTAELERKEIDRQEKERERKIIEVEQKVRQRVTKLKGTL